MHLFGSVIFYPEKYELSSIFVKRVFEQEFLFHWSLLNLLAPSEIMKCIQVRGLHSPMTFFSSEFHLAGRETSAAF
jgi:hypothetical protein